ncbi:hypothetical protein QAD02_006371 [Eretmocerus hayati]|uniref:Uncharacterized protein n=1 Tax=Eretmocerus hayati TaxID=131215 RepID=A0ACC2N107_9HYME|nr:hypothetical protein QAD02_006371 [Eretmocerus hayati]
MSLLRIATLLINVQLYFSEDVPKVLTKLGKIKGYYKTSYNQNVYKAFEGVPYALPPTGEQRFEVPKPIQPWSNELVANKIAEQCISFGEFLTGLNHSIIGSEDCLYMNIYSPVKRDGLLPVIVHFHGGAFILGSYMEDEAHYLMDHDIIYVTVNYRIGILGFLSTGDEIIPGNMGLKDQSLAMKWVKDNIESFGGDPNRITITGFSAGAASVHLHYLSPLSRGLFHSGISFSGTAFKCWSQTGHAKERAMKLGAAMGCPTTDTELLVKCLKKRPARDLTAAIRIFMPWHWLPFTPFGPTIEEPSATAFLTRSPAEMFHSGDYYDVPWVTGVVSEEGIFPVAEFAENDTALQELDENWEDLAPFLLDYNYTSPKEEHFSVAKSIREHYFRSENINRENIKSLIKLASDRFSTDTVRAVIAHAKTSKSPVRMYYYSYKAEKSSIERYGIREKNYGVAHGDDVFMVLKHPRMTSPVREDDLAMQKILISLWVSVAQNKKPDLGVEWSTVDSRPGKLTEANLNFLHIGGPENLKEEHNVEFLQNHFWNSLGLDENTHGDTDCECN